MLPSTTPTDSTLEIDTSANRTAQTTLSQTITTESTVPTSLVPATRSRSELEQESRTSTDILSSSISLGIVLIYPSLFNLIIYQKVSLSLPDAADPELTRTRKRQRLRSSSPVTSSHYNTIDQPITSSPSRIMRKLSESDRDSPLSVSPDNLNALAGPSCSPAFEGVGATNGHANGFIPVTNGNLGAGVVIGNGVQKHGKLVSKVNLPGTTLYDDSFVDRQEFVRLVIQSLRDVGYMYVFHPFCFLFYLCCFKNHLYNQ